VGQNQPQLRAPNRHRVIALLLALVLLSACAPSNQQDEELRKEIKALKAQITAMQSKLDQLQGEQQAIISLLKQPAAPAPTPVPPPEPTVLPGQPPAPPSLTVGQLLASKDRYVGARVTVKGLMGPVMMHHKSFMLKSPQGMIEVLFANLPDPKTIQTLSSSPLEDKPVTVTGVVNLSPARGAGAQLQISAEAVQF
jgi:outer membrane murein-binding lipoprotein Lpp